MKNIQKTSKTTELQTPKCLIDKVKILGNPNEKFDLSNLVNDSGESLITKVFEPSRRKLQTTHYEFMFGGRMEYAPSSIITPKIWFDFNHNKSDQSSVLSCLNLMNDRRLSYLEIAIDYNIDLSELLWLDVKNRKKSVIYIDQFRRLETIYIGSKESKLQYVVYDRNACEGIKNAELPWWRVEARLRFKKPKCFTDIETYLPFDLFSDLKGVPSPEGNIADVAQHYYFNCFQTEILKLKPQRRKKLLNMAGTRSKFKQPMTVYQENRERLQEIISSWL